MQYLGLPSLSVLTKKIILHFIKKFHNEKTSKGCNSSFYSYNLLVKLENLKTLFSFLY